jgi:hypothetical protein
VQERVTAVIGQGQIDRVIKAATKAETQFGRPKNELNASERRDLQIEKFSDPIGCFFWGETPGDCRVANCSRDLIAKVVRC